MASEDIVTASGAAPPISRRLFVGLTLGVPAYLAACRNATAGMEGDTDPSRLRIPTGSPTTDGPTGTQLLTVGDRRAYIHVPPAYRSSTALPLVIAFHGAGGRGTDWVNYPVRTDAASIFFLAVESLGSTWDALNGPFGPDVEVTNAALVMAFQRYAIDPRRLALLGFSDGASYALALGLANGDQVGNVLAHSPGYIPDGPRRGLPSFFVSHGTSDTILPINQASRQIVPRLRSLGATVQYEEFEGGHEVPTSIEDDAVSWLKRQFG